MSHKDWLDIQTLLEELKATNDEEVEILSSDFDSLKSLRSV